MKFEIERVADTECGVGEGPLWHTDEQVLYWRDLTQGDIYRYNPNTDEHDILHSTPLVGGFTIQEDGSLLLFMEDGRIQAWDHGRTETILEDIPAERGGRFNDVIADPRGRVFAGTISADDHLGRVYRVATDTASTIVEDGLDLPNGIAFSPDRSTLYLADSGQDTDKHSGRLYRYDYDEKTGDISNRRLVVDVSDEEGLPDGLTVDADGDLWSARWNGGCVVKYAPDGTELGRIEFPARKVSSVMFGGVDFEHLYVTTACLGTRAEEGDGAGALFRLTPDVHGLSEYRSAIAGP